MKRALVPILALALACPASPAWSAEFSSGHRKAATDLLELMKESQDLADSASAMIDAQVEANPQLAPFKDVLLQWIRKYITWETIEHRMTDLYMETFTESELRDLVAFYRTPTGRKSLEKLPVLMQEGMKIGEEAAEQHRGELERMIRARAEELERAGRRQEIEAGATTEVAQGWLARANQYYDQGKWNDAKNAFLKYLEENPEDASALADLGVCYKELGDFERAIRNFDRALVLSPGHWQALYNKVLVLGFHLGKKEEARRLMRELQRLEPNNPDVTRLAREVAKL